MTRAPVVVCDPGVDDFLALVVLSGAGCPPAAVIGTAGNVDVDQAYVNAAGIVALLGIDVPVAKGAESGLLTQYPETGDPFHGADGLGGIASQLPALSGSEHPPEALSLLEGPVVALGALTMVAEAIARGRPITEIMWMGGAVGCAGNMTAVAELNAWLDADACDAVLSSGIPMSMVPLDVTHQVSLTREDAESLGNQGSRTDLVVRACAHFHDRGIDLFPHDAIAAVAHVRPELFGWEDRWVRCELTGVWTRGMTVVDRRSAGARGSVRVAVDLDAAAVKQTILEALRTLE
jgi:inosine-uridine nucleoside N-ribohydrolase